MNVRKPIIQELYEGERVSDWLAWCRFAVGKPLPFECPPYCGAQLAFWWVSRARGGRNGT
jgi:hypothetical protein